MYKSKRLEKKDIFKAIFGIGGCFFALVIFILTTSAASRNWIQNSWSGGATSTTADHTNDATGHTYYESKDNEIDASGSLITDGLIAHWAFENDTTDNIGTNDGIASGSPTYTAGVSGQALSLDGNDDFVEVSDTDELDLTASFTISMWVKKNESGRYQTLFDKGSIKLSIGDDDRLYFQIASSTLNFEYRGYLNSGSSKQVFSMIPYHGDLYGSGYDPAEIYRYDSGTTWTKVGELPGSGTNSAYALHIFNDRLLSTVRYNPKVFQYESDLDWSEKGYFPSNTGTRSMTNYNGRLYVTTNGTGNVYRLDPDNTWSNVGQPGSSSDTSPITVFDNKLYVGIYDSARVYRYDGGTTWTEVGNFSGENNVFSLSVFQNHLLATTNGKIFRYNGGSSWTEIGDLGASNSKVWAAAEYNGRLYAGGEVGSGHLFRYEGGTTWTDLGQVGSSLVTMSFLNYDGLLHIGTYDDSHVYGFGAGAGVFSSKNIGNENSHLSISYNGSQMSLYINGELNATTSSLVSPEVNDLNILLGNSYGSSYVGYNSSGEQNFRGEIDEVKIYNRALSDTEILSNYKAEKYDDNNLFLTATSTSTTHTANSDFSGTATNTEVSGGDIQLDYIGGVADTSEYEFLASSTVIYRSNGPGNTNELASGTASFLVSINSSGTTTFTGGTIPDNVGVGDVIVYDVDNDDDIDADDAILFIHGRTNNITYTLRTGSGSSTITSTTSGNDTWAIYRAYTSLANAESGTTNPSIPIVFDSWSGGRDIASAGEVWNIACYADDEDSTQTDIGGWVTSTSTYLRIFTPYLLSEVGVSQRHNGTWGNGYRRTSGISTRNPNIRIEGIAARVTSTSWANSPFSGTSFTGSGEIFISDCYADVTPTGVVNNLSYAFWNLGHDVVINIYNSIAIQHNDYNDRGGFNFYDGTNLTANLYNCTSITKDGGGIAAFHNGDTAIVNLYNCLGYSEGSSYPTFQGVFNTVSNCASNDDSLLGIGTNNRYDQEFSFVDLDNNDFHLKYDDTGALGYGQADPASGLFSDDIDGHLRYESWDIGADQYSGYSATGTYVSQAISVSNIDMGIADWTTLTTTTSVRFRTGTTSDMTGAPAWGTCYEYWDGYDISNSSCVTDGQPYLQYQVELSTTDQFTTPTFSDISISYDIYNSSGSLISSPFDWQDDESYLNELSWIEELNSGNVQAYLRTAGTEAGLSSVSWSEIARGDCSVAGSNVFCGSSALPSGLKDGINDQWAQYRVSLTSSASNTPTFSSISISSDQLSQQDQSAETGDGNSHLPVDAFLPPKKPDPSTLNPEGEFKVFINDDAEFTGLLKASLLLLAGDNVSQMAISEDPNFTYASLEPYQKEKEFVLSPTEGEKTIYVKFYTKYGQVSEKVSDTIIYQDISNKESGLSSPETEQQGVTALNKTVNYINPRDGKQYSIASPASMFQVMKKVGLGATNSFIKNTTSFPSRLWGYILIDVDDLGKAYFIKPKDSLKYYLGRPAKAFEIIKGFLD